MTDVTGTTAGPEPTAGPPAENRVSGAPPVEALPCGRDPIETVDRAAAGRSNEHERGCPHCRAAIGAATRSSRAAVDLGAADTAEVTVPDTLVTSVMRSVWSELRASTDIPLPTPGGTVSVTDRAIVSTLQFALDAMDTLIVRSCRIDVGPTVAVRISAAGAYLADLAAEAQVARRIVDATLLRQFGLHVDPIDVQFVDVFLPADLV